nr:hypothetical protein [uncultured Cohaesibacter sp.]
MQKFGNLNKWRLVREGDPIQFSRTARVRLEVVTPANTNWSVGLSVNGKGEYFTSTNGHDVLEFEAQKGLVLSPDHDVRVFSCDGDSVHIEETGKPSFTRIANRQQRNPELEMVAAKAAENATRRIDQMYREELRRRDEQIRELGERVDRSTGEILDTPDDGAGDTEAVSSEEQDDTAPRTKVAPRSAKQSEAGKGKGDELSNGIAPIDE